MSDEVLIFSGTSTVGADDFELLDGAPSSLLPTETIKSNLEAFMGSVREIIPVIGSAGDYSLDTVQVAVGINGKGKVGFLGVGGELGGTATLTLTFKRGNYPTEEAAQASQEEPEEEEAKS